MDVKNVTIVGTGMIGSDVSLLCAMSGYSVTMLGRSDAGVERGLTRFRKNLAGLVEAAIFTQKDAEDIQARLHAGTDRPTALADADIAFEAVSEKLELKQEIFAQLDACCPKHTLLLSGTSGLSPNDIGAGVVQHQQQIMVCHFWNPPYLVPLVELVAHEATSQDTIETVMGFLKSLKKTPVLLKKDIAGHIGNRLQHAIFREAMHLVEQGVATPEDIDLVIMSSLGLRYSMIGPMEYMDSVGLDLQVDVQSYLFETLADAKKPQNILVEKNAQGHDGAKSGKGFYDWNSKKNLDEMVFRQNTPFIERLKAFKKSD